MIKTKQKRERRSKGNSWVISSTDDDITITNQRAKTWKKAQNGEGTPFKDSTTWVLIHFPRRRICLTSLARALRHWILMDRTMEMVYPPSRVTHTILPEKRLALSVCVIWSGNVSDWQKYLPSLFLSLTLDPVRALLRIWSISFLLQEKKVCLCVLNTYWQFGISVSTYLLFCNNIHAAYIIFQFPLKK